MTELIVEQVNETVIDIEGGPTLSTTVDDTIETIVQEFIDPIVVDLNSGPRGEPGAAIRTGAYPPDTAIGVMGDMYIVTQGSTLVGQVFKKTSPATWTDEGNVRGPAGGVNTVNGYTGPDVNLVKADVGLGNVDNTSDVNKPISTATQTALTALDNATVKLAGAQVITGAKSFSIAPVVPANSFAIDRVTGLQAELNLKALDSAVVKISTNQLVGGVKSFTQDIILMGSSLVINQPDTAGGWARGINFKSIDGTITTAGLGAYGGAGSLTYIYFGHGADPFLGALGLKITTNGAAHFSHSVTAVSFTGNGASITALNGSQVTSGTVADARLSANIFTTNTPQTVTAATTFSAAVTVPAPSAASHASTKKYVDDTIAILTNGSPALLNTLDELAQAIGDDPNFATTIANSIALKAPIASPTFTGTITGNGSGLTELNGSRLTTGTVADARLSTKVVLLTGTQTLSGAKTFSIALVVPDNSFAIAKTSGLQAALDTKSPTTHGHALTDANITGIIPDAKLPTRLGTIAATITDWNTAVTNGWYMATAAANAPDTQWWIGTVVAHNSGFVIQEIAPFTNVNFGSGTTFFTGRQRRVRINGTWGAWHQLIDSQADLETRFVRNKNMTNAGAPGMWVRAGVVDGSNSVNGGTLTLLVSGQGGLGNMNRATTIVHFSQRGDNLYGFEAFSFGTDSANVQWYVKQVSTYKFELWMSRGAYGMAISVTELARQGGAGTAMTMDSETTTQPTGLTLQSAPANLSDSVVRVVHTGTAWPTRPTSKYVEWVGPVQPSAATANDTWVNTGAW